MKRFVWLGSIVLVVVLLWSAAWFAASLYITSTVQALADAEGVSSPRLACDDVSVGGFPFRFDVTCRGASLAQGDLTVSLPQLRASVLVYRPTHVLAFAQSPIAFSDAFTGSSNELAFADLTLSASLAGWRIGRISLVGNDLVLSDTLLERQQIAAATRVEAHLLDIEEQHDPERELAALALYVKAQQVAAPVLGLTEGQLEAEAELSAVPNDVRRFAEPDPIRRWQAAGGELTLVSVRAQEREGFISGEGTLALDDTGQLEGQVLVTSQGLADRILETFVAEPFRSLMLGEETPDGTHTQSWAARDGVIFAGLVPAGTVPPLF